MRIQKNPHGGRIHSTWFDCAHHKSLRINTVFWKYDLYLPTKFWVKKTRLIVNGVTTYEMKPNDVFVYEFKNNTIFAINRKCPEVLQGTF